MARRHLHIMLMSLFLTHSTQAQPEHQLELAIQPASKLWLEGTSTMHEYTAKTTLIRGSAVVDSIAYAEGKGGQSTFLRNVEITIPVNTLSSGDEKLDENMYDALKGDDHESITYRMSNASVVYAVGDSATLTTVGTLSVGGKEKEVEMTVTLLKHEDGVLRIKGYTDLLMTDFDIDPPTFMFVLTTDNKVKISFDLLLQSQTEVHK